MNGFMNGFADGAGVGVIAGVIYAILIKLLKYARDNNKIAVEAVTMSLIAIISVLLILGTILDIL